MFDVEGIENPVEKVGMIEAAFYNSAVKSIKVQVSVDNEKGGNISIGADIPHTRFTFRPGMDIDEEMEKTANLMPGNKITIIFNGEK